MANAFCTTTSPGSIQASHSDISSSWMEHAYAGTYAGSKPKLYACDDFLDAYARNGIQCEQSRPTYSKRWTGSECFVLDRLRATCVAILIPESSCCIHRPAAKYDSATYLHARQCASESTASTFTYVLTCSLRTQHSQLESGTHVWSQLVSCISRITIDTSIYKITE